VQQRSKRFDERDAFGQQRYRYKVPAADQFEERLDLGVRAE